MKRYDLAIDETRHWPITIEHVKGDYVLYSEAQAEFAERDKRIEELKGKVFSVEGRLELAINMYLSHKNKSMVELKREIGQQLNKINALEAQLAEAKTAKEVAESIAYTVAHPCPSPCGHSSQFAYTEDGGQHIYCYICQLAAENRKLAEAQTWIDSAEVLINTFEKRYQELIMAVSNKFPNETRHETALRYIKEREYAANHSELKDIMEEGK